MVKFLLAISCLWAAVNVAEAQELNCKVNINHTQVQGTNNSVFETLEKAITEFVNNRAWTELQFEEVEKIDCTLNIIIQQYNESENKFTGQLLFQSTRPVFNSSYTTTVFSMKDENFSFIYKEYDPLEFMETNIDNNLTAILAYYAYLFIGMDLDTMSPLGGTDVLEKALYIVNNSQSLGGDKGWKAFDDSKNRHAIINDYLDSSMEPFRQLMYIYHRTGLDEMANNADRGRVAIGDALQQLKEAHSNKPLSMLPQIFTDYKRDELVNIYKGHGTDKERETAYEILSDINASQSHEWDKIKK